jgi:hypothetical protein
MRILLSAFVAVALLGGSVAESSAATHKKSQKKKAANTAHRNRNSPTVGTKGFPPKPLPSADPRNPADPQRSTIQQQTPGADNPGSTPVKPPDPTLPTRR